MKKRTTGSVTLTGTLAVCACVVFASPTLADGIQFPLDLTTDDSILELYTEGTNAGYSSGRGVIFFADEAIEINGAELWTKSTTGLNATFELWEIVNTKGDTLFKDATLVRETSGLLKGELGFHGAKFTPLTLTPTQPYWLRVVYDEAADENWFFDFDQTADPPLDLGPVTVLDGTLGGDTFNFVAPFMALQIVPAPGALALLVAALVPARRRRR